MTAVPIPDYVAFLGPTAMAQYELAVLQLQQTTGLVAPDTTYIDPAGDLAKAVLAGEFPNGELTGPQPAGSALRQSFADQFWLYIFRPGADGSLVWVRTPKL